MNSHTKLNFFLGVAYLAAVVVMILDFFKWRTG